MKTIEFEMVRRQERARLEKQSIIDNPLFGDVNKSPGKSAGDAEAEAWPYWNQAIERKTKALKYQQVFHTK